MKKSHIDQGLHNEKVCKHLNRSPEYTDWVITTAFYAAMHLIYGKILPAVIRDKKGGGKARAVTFDELYNYYVPAKDISKHRFSVNYIEEHYPEMANPYQFLFESSQSARYHQYQFPREVSDKAYKHMQAIKTICVPEG